MQALIILAITMGLFSGCSSDKVIRYTENGILVIENPEFGKWQNQDSCPLQIELEKTYGKESAPYSEVFSSISSVFTDSDLNVYFFDFRENILVSYDSEGTLRWAKGRQGEGPGEFNYASGVVYDGFENIYVGNMFCHRIDQFNINGEYIKTLDFSDVFMEHAHLIGYLTPSVLIFSDIIQGTCGAHLCFVDISEKPKIIREIDIKEDLGFELPPGFSMGASVKVNKNYISVSSETSYMQRLFNLKGQEYKRIKRNVKRFKAPYFDKNSMNRPIKKFSILSPLMQLPNNMNLCLAKWPLAANNTSDSNTKHQYSLDLFDSEGVLLCSIMKNSVRFELGYPVHFDKNGKLYTVINDPFPQLRRYKLLINK